MAAKVTRQDIVDAFDIAVGEYNEVLESGTTDEKFELIRGALMRVSNRAYQLYRNEANAPEAITPEAQPEAGVIDVSQPEATEQGSDLAAMTVKQLRDRAKELGIKGFSRMSQEKLVSVIQAHDEVVPA